MSRDAPDAIVQDVVGGANYALDIIEGLIDESGAILDRTAGIITKARELDDKIEAVRAATGEGAAP